MVLRRPRSIWIISISSQMLMVRTDLNKLKHLKAALDGRAAYQIKDLDESDPAKAFAALRAKLLSHFGFPNEASSARQQF